MNLKLFVLDFKTYIRKLGFLFIAAPVFCLGLRLYMNADLDFHQFIFQLIMVTMVMAAVSLVIALAVMSAVVYWKEFYDSLFKDRSYIIQTLPVSTGELYLTKIAEGIVLITIATAILVLCAWLDLEEPLFTIILVMFNETTGIGISLLLAPWLQGLSYVLAGACAIVLARRGTNGSLAKAVGIAILLIIALVFFVMACTFVITSIADGGNMMSAMTQGFVTDMSYFKTIFYAAVAGYLMADVIIVAIGYLSITRKFNVE